MATVQVALQGSARHLQDELAQVAEREDTRSQRGLKPLLQDAALEVLRNLEHCVYGLVSSSRHKSASNAERAFHNDSIESWSQYHEETLSNTLGQQNQAETSSGTREGDAPDECIVVTLLASASASSELPKNAEQRGHAEGAEGIGIAPGGAGAVGGSDVDAAEGGGVLDAGGSCAGPSTAISARRCIGFENKFTAKEIEGSLLHLLFSCARQ
jgi:hypothetical protein